MCSDHSTKVCRKCGITKPFSDFSRSKATSSGLQTKCKSCDKEYRERNKDKICEYLREYHSANRDTLLSKKREYRLKNVDTIRTRDKLWAANNPEKVRANQKVQWDRNRDEYYAKTYLRNAARRKSDPHYAMRLRIAHRIRLALRGMGFAKSKRTQEILGCDYDFFHMHIESQFLPGMTWENRDLWHVDHIVPLASAKTEEDIIRLNHYTNLQPLWAEDNRRKGAKMDYQA